MSDQPRQTSETQHACRSIGEAWSCWPPGSSEAIVVSRAAVGPDTSQPVFTPGSFSRVILGVNSQ